MSGEGMGHATRMTALCKELQYTFDLVFFVPPSVYSFIKSHFPSAPIYTLPYIRLVKKNHKVRLLVTGVRSVAVLLKSSIDIMKIRQQVKRHGIIGILTDYDPFMSIIGKSLKLPIIALNHQGIIDRVPIRSVTHVAAWISNRFMIPFSTTQLVCSFFNGDVGPILREDITRHDRSDKGHIVVYLAHYFKKDILPVLEEFKEEKFVFFPDPSKELFEWMASAKAIISPSGHQFLCESLYFNKPVFSVPIKNQFEQQLNATALERSGRGKLGHVPSLKNELKEFLDNLDRYKQDKTPEGFCFENDVKHAAELVRNEFIAKNK